MENQHREIKGYRELSSEEIALMNEIYTKGAELDWNLDNWMMKSVINGIRWFESVLNGMKKLKLI